MTDHPERVYCSRCGCSTRAYVPGRIAGQAFQGNLTCAGCGAQYPGEEIEAAKAGKLTYHERCWVDFIAWELDHRTRPDEVREHIAERAAGKPAEGVPV